MKGAPANPAIALGSIGLLYVASALGMKSAGRFVLPGDSSERQDSGFLLSLDGNPSEIVGALACFRANSEFREVRVRHGERVTVLDLRLGHHGRSVSLDWWVDWDRGKASPLSFWAGNVTPKRVFDKKVGRALDLATKGGLPELGELMGIAGEAETGSLTGFDARGAWNTYNLGFSLDRAKKAGWFGRSLFFPFAEVLAAIGLQAVMPLGGGRVRRDPFVYHVWTDVDLPLPLARLAFLGEEWLGLGAVVKYTSIPLPKGRYITLSMAATDLDTEDMDALALDGESEEPEEDEEAGS